MTNGNYKEISGKPTYLNINQGIQFTNDMIQPHDVAVVIAGRSYKILSSDADLSFIKANLNYLPKELPTFQSFANSLRQLGSLSEKFKNYTAEEPKESSEISEEGKKNLLNNLEDETRLIAERALKEIRYIPFNEFLEGLKASTFKLKMHIKNEPFVIVYDPLMEKSSVWTTKLAYQFLEKITLIPVRVEEWSWFDNSDLARLEEYQAIKHIVIYDDASYSGTQMRRAVEALHEKGSLKKHFPNATITIVVPFITDEALAHMELIKTKIIYHDKMKCFPEDLVFRCNNEAFKGFFNGCTATYFQHKLAAEGHSIPPLAKAGLVKEIRPPYKG